MAFFRSDGYIGGQAIADTSTTKNHVLGEICRARDTSTSGLGEGEFIYLLGVSSTVVGSPVTWHPLTYQTTLAAVGAGKPQALAFAMSANGASSYGWYQISGKAYASKSASISLAAGVAVAIKTTALVSVTGTGKEIQGAIVAAVASAATGRITVLLDIMRPHYQGRIT